MSDREEILKKTFEELGITLPDVMCGSCLFAPREIAEKFYDLVLAESEKEINNLRANLRLTQDELVKRDRRIAELEQEKNEVWEKYVAMRSKFVELQDADLGYIEGVREERTSILGEVEKIIRRNLYMENGNWKLSYPLNTFITELFDFLKELKLSPSADVSEKDKVEMGENPSDVATSKKFIPTNLSSENSETDGDKHLFVDPEDVKKIHFEELRRNGKIISMVDAVLGGEKYEVITHKENFPKKEVGRSD